MNKKEIEFLDEKIDDKNRLTNNKNAMAMIKIIEEHSNEYPTIIESFKKQLKKDRFISEKQFKIIISNLPKIS